jgi:hypothetical protein
MPETSSPTITIRTNGTVETLIPGESVSRFEPLELEGDELTMAEALERSFAGENET